MTGISNEMDGIEDNMINEDIDSAKDDEDNNSGDNENY